MDTNLEVYEEIINEINKNTEELAKVNEKIATITLNKEEEKLLEELIAGYKEEGLYSEYIQNRMEEYKNHKNLYKYLKLFKKGLETNETINILLSAMTDEVVEDE